MTDQALYEITNDVPLPTASRSSSGKILALLYALEPGESFLCTHYASGSIDQLAKTDPGRKFTRRRDPASRLVRIWRTE